MGTGCGLHRGTKICVGVSCKVIRSLGSGDCSVNLALTENRKKKS